MTNRTAAGISSAGHLLHLAANIEALVLQVGVDGIEIGHVRIKIRARIVDAEETHQKRAHIALARSEIPAVQSFDDSFFHLFAAVAFKGAHLLVGDRVQAHNVLVSELGEGIKALLVVELDLSQRRDEVFVLIQEQLVEGFDVLFLRIARDVFIVEHQHLEVWNGFDVLCEQLQRCVRWILPAGDLRDDAKASVCDSVQPFLGSKPTPVGAERQLGAALVGSPSLRCSLAL